MLFIVLAIYFFIKRRYALGVFSYLAALLIKPQALIFAPIMLFGAVKGMIECAQDFRGENGMSLKSACWPFPAPCWVQ